MILDYSLDLASNPEWRDVTDVANGMFNSQGHNEPSNPFFVLERNIAAFQTNAFLQELAAVGNVEISDPKSGAFAIVALAAVEMTAARGAGRSDLSVRTLSATNEELLGLRLFRVSEANYRANCLDENKEEFDKRSSPATAVVPIAKWWVWAEDDAGRRSVPREVPLVGPQMNIDYTIVWAEE